MWGKCKEIPLISLLTRASSRSTFVEPLRGSWEPRLRNTPPVIGEFRLVSHTNGLPFRPLCPVSSMACQPMVQVYEAYTSWRHTCSASFMAIGACIIIPSSTFVRDGHLQGTELNILRISAWPYKKYHRSPYKPVRQGAIETKALASISVALMPRNNSWCWSQLPVSKNTARHGYDPTMTDVPWCFLCITQYINCVKAWLGLIPPWQMCRGVTVLLQCTQLLNQMISVVYFNNSI